ncbi:nitrogen fixation protein NifX [Azotobacter beijerinckii]|uniref:Nitrogen fixation protein NifX n=1 Tax=Azotobacter beijerinckii TaxID=170623 RepID=A0A1H9EZZ4_9GAMM|nr:NifB/NifX family molybdenum-iron cluster-binding protein [Azotobacter beijerinckii]SEQ30783.1 nitrogen fixation protein NifX [Azotobacter beijerinckii]
MNEIGHLKIAITSNDLLQVDANFATAKQIVIYDVTYDEASFLDVVQFKGGGKGGDGKRGPGGGGCSMGDPTGGASVDQVQLRVDAMEGCAVLFTLALSDFAAVKVKNAGVFPVKMQHPREIDEVVEHLQRMMQNNPPLWLRKALGYGVRNPDYLIEREA